MDRLHDLYTANTTGVQVGNMTGAVRQCDRCTDNMTGVQTGNVTGGLTGDMTGVKRPKYQTLG